MKKHSIGSLLFIGLVLVIMYLPIAVVVVYSFNANTARIPIDFTGWTTAWYGKLFENRSGFGDALLLSVRVALWAVVISCVIGTLGAIGMANRAGGRHSRLDTAMESLMSLPIMIPEIILGMVFLSVFSLMGLPFGMVTLVIAHTTFCVPYIFTMVRARLVGMDHSLEEAALDLGASKWQVFRDVILPQILPAILSGVLLAFAMSFDDVVISIFVTGPKVNTLPVKIYTKLKTGVTPEINALATVMLLVILLCLIGAYLLGRKCQAPAGEISGEK